MAVNLNENGVELIVTGGAGFIGSNFLSHMVNKYPNIKFINIDKLGYAGNMNNVAHLSTHSNYQFVHEDIANYEEISKLVNNGSIIVNFAAESHVDNSIKDPFPFSRTNVLGTHTLLEVARQKGARLFVQVSTDEVYGSLKHEDKSSTEEDLLKPSSPYSASKAAAEMLCLGNIKTFNQPIIITRSSNNFGPYQFPEKVIPLFVTNLLTGKKVPLYGTGMNVRDWLYVQDNCEAIEHIIINGKAGEIYNIGGGNEIPNIELTKKILNQFEKDDSHIEFVEDRKGHDFRYSLDCSKIHSLGWKPRHSFEEALKKTVDWYKENNLWWEPLKNTAGKRVA